MVTRMPHGRQQAVVPNEINAVCEFLKSHAEFLRERCGKHHPQTLVPVHVIPSICAADAALKSYHTRGSCPPPGQHQTPHTAAQTVASVTP